MKREKSSHWTISCIYLEIEFPKSKSKNRLGPRAFREDIPNLFPCHFLSRFVQKITLRSFMFPFMYLISECLLLSALSNPLLFHSLLFLSSPLLASRSHPPLPQFVVVNLPREASLCGRVNTSVLWTTSGCTGLAASAARTSSRGRWFQLSGRPTIPAALSAPCASKIQGYGNQNLF